jgi:hypothetical protein
MKGAAIVKKDQKKAPKTGNLYERLTLAKVGRQLADRKARAW